MLFFIKPIARLLALLNSNSKPQAVAAAIACAFLLALIPAGNVLWIALFILTLVFKLNWGFELVFIALFKGPVIFLDRFLEPLGWKLMNISSVSSLIHKIDEIPGLFFLGLNNSLVIGGLVCGIIIWFPVFFLGKILVNLFREKISPGIARSKIVMSIKKAPFMSNFLNAFQQFSGMYE
ncbi:MAG: TIGR03546 family protein [Spirochaetales bacterium]|nr:TIGR03546 family protein [Spirochaetales bacterium]